jgi:hypothetical protein
MTKTFGYLDGKQVFKEKHLTTEIKTMEKELTMLLKRGVFSSVKRPRECVVSK